MLTDLGSAVIVTGGPAMKTRTLILAAAWLFSGLVYADPPPHSHRGPDMDRIALLLDLDDYQKSEVQKVLEAQHEQMHVTMEQERSGGQHPSREEMQARHEQLQKDTLDKLSSILNEQQLKKFAALTDHPPGATHHRGGEPSPRSSQESSQGSASQGSSQPAQGSSRL
jgi:Spy/CpxP family protein refolding chaperone